MGNPYIERIVGLACRGRTMVGEPALDEPITVEVKLYRRPIEKIGQQNAELFEQLIDSPRHGFDRFKSRLP